MASEVDLANTALRRLGQDPIIRIDDTSVSGRRIKAALPIVRDEVLRRDTWRCAMKRQEIPSTSEAPLGFSNSFPLPNDFIKLAALKLDQYTTWELLGNAINCNYPDNPLQIMYVYRLTDTNQYSPELFDVMAWRLAVELSGLTTTSTVRQDETYSMYMQSLETAINLNALENPMTYLDSTAWVDARFSNIDRGLYGFNFYSVG